MGCEPIMGMQGSQQAVLGPLWTTFGYFFIYFYFYFLTWGSETSGTAFAVDG